MGDCLDQLGLAHAVLAGAAEVETQLVGVATGDQGGDGDEAAVAGGKPVSVPDVVEEDVVGDLSKLGGNVTDAAAPPPICLGWLACSGVNAPPVSAVGRLRTARR